jgi:hypothetical protein
MHFRDAKVGETINVWVNKQDGYLTVNSDCGRSKLILALVLENENDSTVIGWKPG